MTDDGRCVHGQLGPCGLCVIDRRKRIGPAAAEHIRYREDMLVSGTCELRIHDECRMIGCDCRCHQEPAMEALERCVQPMDCDEGEFEAIGVRASCLGCVRTVGQFHEEDCPELS